MNRPPRSPENSKVPRMLGASLLAGIALLGAERLGMFDNKPQAPATPTRTESVMFGLEDVGEDVARNYLGKDATRAAVSVLGNDLHVVGRGEAKFAEPGTVVRIDEFEDGSRTLTLERDPNGDNE